MNGTASRASDPRRIKHRVEVGIRRDSYGFEASVSCGPRYETRRFPIDTPLAAIRRWREEERRVLGALRDMTPVEVENLPRSLSGWCYIYVLRDGDLVKIGRAVNVKQRVTELQTGHHRRLELMAAIPAHASLEAAIHQRFDRARQHGEWFVLTDSLRRFIEKANAGENPVALLW